MIRHIVLFSAKSSEDIDVIVEGLRILGDIPGVLDFEVSRNLKRDALSRDIDVVVHAVFQDDAALQQYKEHPLYQAAIDVVRPLRSHRVVADYEFDR